MTAVQTESLRAELDHAIGKIQAQWSQNERVRRHRLAERRQRRLVRLMSPRPEREAYDCMCDKADDFGSAGDGQCPGEQRSHCYVVIEG